MKNNKLEDLEKEFIRDICSVSLNVKSEVRRRLNEILENYIEKEEVENIRQWLDIERKQERNDRSGDIYNIVVNILSVLDDKLTKLLKK